MTVPIVIGVVAFIAVSGTLVALWWWHLADRWAKSEHERRFRPKAEDEPETIVISPNSGRDEGEPR